MAASVQVEEVLLCQVSAGCVVEASERGCSASRARKSRCEDGVRGRQKQVTVAEDSLSFRKRLTCLQGSDCPSPRHPLSVRCTYPAGSHHCVPACLLARTLLLVAFSRRVVPLVCTPLPAWRSGYCAEELAMAVCVVACSR